MSFVPPSFSDILGQNYAQLPQESRLLLATSILGISTSWLSQSFLLDSQKPYAAAAGRNANAGAAVEPVPTVIVSFTNDFEFYRTIVRRMGIDLALLTKKKQFAFVDGLSNLFSPSSTAIKNNPTISTAPFAPSLDQSPTATSNGTQLLPIQKAIEAAISSLSLPPQSASNPRTAHYTTSSQRIKPRLIIESPDVLTSAACIDAQSVVDMLLDLRELCSVTLISLSADIPFVSAMLEDNRASATELEINQAALVSGLAHVADAVVGLRRLDTGVAQDVTGVIRVTKGGGSGWWGKGDGGVEEKEVLYYVGDRDVKMFGRGEHA